MGPAVYWAVAQLRRRWASTIGVALLVAVTCAIPTAAAAGARRTDSVVDRVQHELRAADVQLQVEELDDEATKAVRALPGVEQVGVRSTIFLRPADTDLKPFLEFFAVGSMDGVSGYQIFRPRMDQGRLPSPDEPHEVLVSRPVAERLHLQPGDHFSVETLTLDAVFASFETGDIPEPDGPTIEVEVTGVGLLAPELLAPEQIPNGTILFTPAFLERYGEQVAAFSDTLDIDLADSPGAVDAFIVAAQDALGTDRVFVTPVEQELAQVRDGVAVQRTALLLFLAVAALAGAVAVAQAASRTAARHDDDLVTLAALGFGARQRVAAVVGLFIPAIAGGVVVGLLLAVGASRWLPFGLAARLEPDPGVHADWLVLAGGAAVTAVGGLLAITASAALTDWRRRQTTVHAEPPLVASLAAWSRPSVAIGVRWALVPGRGRSATPVRSALAGTALGLGGTLAALSFGASLDRLVDTPGRYGVNHDLVVGVVGDESTDAEALEAADELATRDEVRALSLVRVSKVNLRGETHDAFGIDARRGDIGYSVVAGRAPATDTEVVLGTSLLRELGLDVGDEMVLEGGTTPLTIVGRGLFPPLDDANSLATGLGFTLTGLATARDDLGPASASSGFPEVLVDVAPGVDVEELRRAYVAEFGFARLASRPTSVANLAEAQDVPPLVAAFLALLGLLALGHAIVASASRRRPDLAVLRCIGFERRDLAATVRAHTATVVVIGLGVGMPLGVAVGRWSWRLVAADIGVSSDPASVALALAVIVPASLLIALLVAAPSARSAARTRPAIALRTE